MISIPIEKDELIGRVVQVDTCTDPTMRGMVGIIIDETKQMFLVSSYGKQRWIAKDIATFCFPHQNQENKLMGSKLRFRPEERVKKAR
jgi:RNase P/RNase MRP subunit p29